MQYGGGRRAPRSVVVGVGKRLTMDFTYWGTDLKVLSS
jgi:hypothetical protein